MSHCDRDITECTRACERSCRFEPLELSGTGATDVLGEIVRERDYQLGKWGRHVDLHVNTPMDFVGYIAHHSSRWFGGGFRPYSRETLQAFRKQMVKVAALALAAIEHVDAILNGEVLRTDVLAYGAGAADRG